MIQCTYSTLFCELFDSNVVFVAEAGFVYVLLKTDVSTGSESLNTFYFSNFIISSTLYLCSELNQQSSNHSDICITQDVVVSLS